MSTLPFHPPKLVRVKRGNGFVNLPEEKDTIWEQWTGRNALVIEAEAEADKIHAISVGHDASVRPTLLQRSQSMAGHIVVFEPDGEPAQAFWLQRKIGCKVGGGIIRLGYRLQSTQQTKDASESWELDVDEEGNPLYVKVVILARDVLGSHDQGHNAINELSALQLVAENSKGVPTHVQGSSLLGACEKHVYAILPHYPDGTLMQYTMSQGNLKESNARVFFRQILQGLKTLQDLGLCHRNLSLDSIELNGNHATITQLDWSMRFTSNSSSNDPNAIPIPGGISPLFVAPEYFRGSSGEWDGFAADLWAAGVMLYIMVVGIDALFAAPVTEDTTFVALCIDGKIRETVHAYAETSGKAISLTDDLVELLEKMLTADPTQRYSLDDVIGHRWVKIADVD